MTDEPTSLPTVPVEQLAVGDMILLPPGRLAYIDEVQPDRETISLVLRHGAMLPLARGSRITKIEPPATAAAAKPAGKAKQNA